MTGAGLVPARPCPSVDAAEAEIAKDLQELGWQRGRVGESPHETARMDKAMIS